MTSMGAGPVSWRAWVDGELDGVRGAGRWRSNIAFDGAGPKGVRDGVAVTSFASNDYLGLSNHPSVVAAAHDALDRWGTGAGSSRLVAGTRPAHHDLEAAVADWKHAEGALVFSSGYAANVGVLATLGAGDVTIFSDERNHASIIDGCRLARATTVVYRHGDLDHLGALLAAATGRTLVVTEAVFSMDGDRSPIDGLVELCRRHDALLVVDEAHDVLGSAAPPIAPPAARYLTTDRDGVTVVRVGTLSKALGSLGGWVAAPRPVIDLLVNRARTYIFTTALSPADVAAARAALEVVRSPEGAALVRRLGDLADRVRTGHASPIIACIVGDEADAVAAGAALLAEGIFVPAIRPPTVAPGTSRLRVSLSAVHTDAMVNQLVAALVRLGLAS